MPTTADLIGRYVELRDHIEVATKQFETSLAPYKQAMEVISAAVTEEINRLDGQSIKTEKGTAFRQEWTAVKVADRELFFDFIFGEREFESLMEHTFASDVAAELHELHTKLQVTREFMTSAVSKDVVKEHLEKNNGVLPPGLDFTSGYKTLFRRA